MTGTFSSFFLSKETPRWQLMAGGLIVIAAAFGQNYYFFQKEQRLEAAAEAERRVEDKLLEIQRQSVDFQTYAGAFVSAVLDQAPSVDEHRKRLIDNLIAQDTAIDVSARIFDPQAKQAADEYRSALKVLKGTAESAHDVLSLSSFWTAASDLLVARNALLDELSRQMQAAG